MDPLEILNRRQALRSAIRAYFADQGFVEVDTPLLIPANAPELHIEAVPVQIQLPSGRRQVYLRTSPELALKRLIAAGAERIYEIARVARDADHDTTHRIEFTLLEWYRANSGYQALMDDCDALLARSAAALGVDPVVRGPAGTCDLSARAERLSVAEAFRRHAGAEVEPYLGGDSAGLLQAVIKAGLALPESLRSAQESSFEEVFFAAFLSAVEPKLGLGRPTLLYEWPAPMAALARLAPGRPELALRVELYAAGVELANGFDELTDPVEQRQRFEHTAQARAAAGLDPYPPNEAFLTDLSRMPPCAGMALGLERLQLLLTGAADLSGAALPWAL